MTGEAVKPSPWRIDARRGGSGQIWTKNTIMDDLDFISASAPLSPSHEERTAAYESLLREAVGYLVAEFGWEETEDGEPDFMPLVRELFDQLARARLTG